MIIQSCFDTGQFLKNNVVLNILLPWQQTNQHIKSFLDLQPR